MITEEAMREAVGKICLMRYFPGKDVAAKAALIDLLGRMCWNDAQVLRLAEQVTTIYSEWPGPSELRAAMSGWASPADGIEACSSIYSGGIPSIRGLMEGQQSRGVNAGPQPLQIAGPREPVNPVDPVAAAELAKVVSDLPKMPPAPKAKLLGPNGVRVDRELRRMMGEYRGTKTPPQIITEADFEAERKRMELEKAAEA